MTAQNGNTPEANGSEGGLPAERFANVRAATQVSPTLHECDRQAKSQDLAGAEQVEQTSLLQGVAYQVRAGTVSHRNEGNGAKRGKSGGSKKPRVTNGASASGQPPVNGRRPSADDLISEEAVGVACTGCGAALPDASEWVKTIARLERANTALRNELAEKNANHKHRDVIERVCLYWNKRVCGGKARKPTSEKRTRKVAARINEGFSERELLMAIEGAVWKPTVVDGDTYDDLESIMDSAGRVRKHIERAPLGDLEGLDLEIDAARTTFRWRSVLAEWDQLTKEIMAGEGPLLDFHRRLHEARLGRTTLELAA